MLSVINPDSRILILCFYPICNYVLDNDIYGFYFISIKDV